MNIKRLTISITTAVLLTAGFSAFISNKTQTDNILSYNASSKTQDLRFYWKDAKGVPFKSIQNLKTELETKKQKLIFAMNAGMYKKDNSPQGLFIENFVIKSLIDTTTGKGNFYLKPNGVFYIDADMKSVICKTEDFKNDGKIKYATQSGPMLVIEGLINSLFTKGSKNLNIRNGAGILPDNSVVFAMSKTEINFYDFAEYFKNLGCRNALYLDGFISRTYLPEQKWTQADGDFGVIIGITEGIANSK